MNELIKEIKKARFIWICGNGGSAATAEHFTTDLIKKGYPAVCLSSNMSIMTMIANDYGYKYMFSKQLEAYGDKKDLLITISCSGISPNIIEAHITAVKKKMKMYIFDSFNNFEPKLTDYGELENLHLKFAHEVAKAL